MLITFFIMGKPFHLPVSILGFLFAVSGNQYSYPSSIHDYQIQVTQLTHTYTGVKGNRMSHHLLKTLVVRKYDYIKTFNHTLMMMRSHEPDCTKVAKFTRTFCLLMVRICLERKREYIGMKDERYLLEDKRSENTKRE